MASERANVEFRADTRRVLALAHLPGEAPGAVGQPRLERLVQRVLDLDEADVVAQMVGVVAGFADRHEDLEGRLEHRAGLAGHLLDGNGTRLSTARRQLLGAYLTKEYALEAASLSNPSMVPAPEEDQADCGPGELRFVLSLRAIGEGHTSSIEFRCGRIGADGAFSVEQTSPYARMGQRTWPAYDKVPFRQKLDELGADDGLVEMVLEHLPDPFSFEELDRARGALVEKVSRPVAYSTDEMVRRLATSNYVSTFPEDGDISSRVLFPDNDVESRGMEDARFVRFTDDDGSTTYRATYTAYDGFSILPQLLSTSDFRRFRVSTLNGNAAQNKGIALFPRRVGGKVVALSRIGGENISIMASDSIHYWSDASPLKVPEQPWELFQMGNCGSPVETEAGWIVLTHGVGPMRRYCLGALLLDLDDPTRVLARTVDPILEPAKDERDGYVPNVVYSCGGLVHEGRLVLPYGWSDMGARIALLDLDELLADLSVPAALVSR